MATALTVIAGGWKKDEAQIEALAFMDEVAVEADRIWSLLSEMECDYRLVNGAIDVRWQRAKHLAMRVARRATTARIEYTGLTGGAA